MAKERSDKCPFESRFGGGWIASAQYIAEAMCDRQARLQKIALATRFWQHDPWKREFLLQLKHANSLLKNYEVAAVIRALRSLKGKTTYSLGAPSLKPLVKEQQRLLELERQKQQQAVVEPPPSNIVEAPRPAFVKKKSPLDKLRELDG